HGGALFEAEATEGGASSRARREPRAHRRLRTRVALRPFRATADRPDDHLRDGAPHAPAAEPTPLRRGPRRELPVLLGPGVTRRTRGRRSSVRRRLARGVVARGMARLSRTG